jgi:hypothetical protein
VLAAEIDRFEKAVEQRLGEEGMRAAMRSAPDGIPRSVSGIGPEHSQALRQVAHDLAAVRQGRADHDVQRAMETLNQREQKQERVRHRRGLGLGR